MFNREEGLKNLEKLLKNEVEFINLDMLLSIISEKGREIILETMKDKKESFWADKIRGMHPNVYKVAYQNDWIEYSVTLNGESKLFGYVNREKHQFILSTEHGSAFEELESFAQGTWVGRQLNYKKAQKVEEISFDTFEVILKSDIEKQYTLLRETCFLEFIRQREQELLAKCDNRLKEIAESLVLKEFVSDDKVELNKEVEDKIIVESFKYDEYYMSKGVLSIDYVMSPDNLFDFIGAKGKLTEAIFGALQLSLIRNEGTDYLYDTKIKLYCNQIRKDLYEKYDKDYDVLLNREIARCLKCGGKTIRVVKFDLTEVKIENRVADYPYIGFRYSKGVLMNDIQSILFGKKVLFDRNEFDEEYGHLKSGN